VVDVTAAGRRPSGTSVYLDALVPALRALGVDVVAVRNPWRGGPERSTARNGAAEARWLGALVRHVRADVLHHGLPAHAPGARAAQVVTVHDLAPVVHPELFDRRFGLYARTVQRAAARAADAVVVPSDATRADLRAHWGLDATVAPHGPGQPLPGADDRADTPTHLLYVGDAEPRKGLQSLRALDLPLPLVLAGNAGGRTRTPAELAALHAEAAALVHPAVHEGFALTVLEAMRAGTPVVAAASPAVSELTAGAALLVPPGDAAALRAAVHRVVADPALRADLSARGRARAAAFSWERSARAHLAAYREAAARRDAPGYG
jgi:glycosyltransferase involved in cell wall biosynthesis